MIPSLVPIYSNFKRASGTWLTISHSRFLRRWRYSPPHPRGGPSFAAHGYSMAPLSAPNRAVPTHLPHCTVCQRWVSCYKVQRTACVRDARLSNSVLYAESQVQPGGTPPRFSRLASALCHLLASCAAWRCAGIAVLYECLYRLYGALHLCFCQTCLAPIRRPCCPGQVDAHSYIEAVLHVHVLVPSTGSGTEMAGQSG
ncbi:hypothetical protein GGI35DRAFT_286062 [Trichoderma velutinum]